MRYTHINFVKFRVVTNFVRKNAEDWPSQRYRTDLSCRPHHPSQYTGSHLTQERERDLIMHESNTQTKPEKWHNFTKCHPINSVSIEVTAPRQTKNSLVIFSSNAIHPHHSDVSRINPRRLYHCSMLLSFRNTKFTGCKKSSLSSLINWILHSTEKKR